MQFKMMFNAGRESNFFGGLKFYDGQFHEKVKSYLSYSAIRFCIAEKLR
jgi:hypothetical protein